MRKLLLILSLIVCSIFASGQNSFYKDAKGTFWINGNLVKASTALTSFDSKISPTRITVEINGVFHLLSVPISEIQDINGVVYVDWSHFYEENNSFFSSDFDVYLKDQVTPTVILPMALQVTSTTLSTLAAIDTYTIQVASNSGFIVGQHIRIIDTSLDRFYFGSIVTITGTTITLDTPLDFAYKIGSQVIVATINMNVNGSVTPVIFKHRLGSPSTNKATHITRIIITCLTDKPVDLLGFGDLATLIKGIVLRRVNGETINILNVKSNADLSNIAYDLNVYSATNPSQGIDGFVCRLTFAGQEKIGVALSLEVGENLEAIVQDNLTGLVSLKIIAEGHIVEP